MSLNAPTQELLAAGLHRIAQPLTTALWFAEVGDLAGDDEFRTGSTQEIRRAIGVLQALRLILDEVAQAPPATEPLSQLISRERVHWSRIASAASVPLTVAAGPHSSCAKVPCDVFAETCVEILQQLLDCARPDARHAARLSVEVQHVEERTSLHFRMQFDTARAITEEERNCFYLNVDPFNTPRFSFASFEPPALYLLRIRLAHLGIAISPRACPEVLSVAITLPTEPSA